MAEWVVLVLTQSGEDEEPSVVHAHLQRHLKGAEVFIPATTTKNGENQVTHHLVKGYAFASRTLQDSAYVRLEQTKYVESVLTKPAPSGVKGARALSCVRDRDIAKMRAQVQMEAEQGISVGDEVQVTSGAYRNIQGRVIDEIPENDTVQVHIRLISKEAIVCLPRSFLRFVSKNTDELPVVAFNPFATKMSRIQDWIRDVRPIVLWTPPDVAALRTGYRQYERLYQWDQRVDRLNGFVSSFAPDAEEKRENLLHQIQAQASYTQQLDNWCHRGAQLFATLHAATVARSEDFANLHAAQAKLTVLDQFTTRYDTICQGIRNLERTYMNTPEAIDNVIVDGVQLATRVYHALQTPKLASPEGQPTEIVFGFLKSLSALRKRFTAAKFYVAWDGSSQRRRALCPLYKANRTASATTIVADQVKILREVLPLLGVTQAWNPNEEADDVIATLVKSLLSGSHNLIVSVDHDFLQLVTYTDLVFMPKTGLRPEELWDHDRVVSKYGVVPKCMPELRALMGDSSDNLKGVSTVPKKVLTTLLTTHKSIDGIYASGLSGLTPKQYNYVKTAEPVVRLNAQIMPLLTDIPLDITESTLDLEAAAAKLTQYSITPTPITSAWIQEPPKSGFLKTGN